jgi:hypothetical protein
LRECKFVEKQLTPAWLPSKVYMPLKAASRAVAEIPVGRVDEITVMNIANFFRPG